MLSLRRRLFIQIGVPLALSGAFLLVDLLVHWLTHDPWPDAPHLVTFVLLLVGSSAILTAHLRSLAQRAEDRKLLAASEANYRTLFDMFPEPTTVWSRDGVLLMQNLESARRLGGRREDFIGKSLVEIFGPQGVARYGERLRRVYDTGVPDEWEDVLNLPGGRVTYWTSVQRVKQPGAEDAIQVIAYDITKRVEAEAALRMEHERASAYLKVAGALFVALDREGRVTMVNERACELLGYAEAEIIGRDWIADFLPTHLQERVRADYAAMIAGGSSFNGLYENPLLTRSGEERLVTWHGVLLRDDAGQAIGVLR